MREEHKTHIREIRDEHKEHLAMHRDEHKNVISDMRNEHKTQNQEIRDEHSKQLKAINQQHQLQMAEFRELLLQTLESKKKHSVRRETQENVGVSTRPSYSSYREGESLDLNQSD